MAKAAVARDASVPAASEGASPLLVAKKAAKWLTVSSPKGGSGKTTTTINLAVFAAHEGLKVCILDADMQASAADWVELRRKKWSKSANPPPDIHLVHVPLDRIDAAIREVEKIPDLDLVIVDTPTAVEFMPEPTRRLLDKSDLILVPSTTGRPDVRSVTGWMAMLKKDQRRAAFVINRANARATSQRRGDDDAAPMLGTIAFREARRMLNKAGVLCGTPIRQLENIQTTHAVGVGVLEMDGGKANGVDDFEDVWNFVRNMLGM